MRLIDADDLIAKLCDWYTPEPSVEESFEEDFFKGYIEGYIEVVKEIKDLIEQMPTITSEWRWIPCEERQPDETDWYLVTLDDGRRASRWYSTIHDWECIGGNYVIAWLPNPEPYRVFA